MTDSPTPGPTLSFRPTSVTEYYSNTTWGDILLIFWYQLLFGGLEWVLFEVGRRFLSEIYYPRKSWRPLKVPSPPPKFPLAWIPHILTMPGKEVCERAGLDAYMLLRFIRLGMRLMLFATFLGLVVLLPVYASGSSGESGFNRLTLNNLSGSDKVWVATAISFVFTFHAFYLIDNEYANFVEWRLAFLSEGDLTDVKHQSRYTIQLEGIPPQLKTNAALQRFLNSVFPGKVFCANVQINLHDLHKIHERRLVVVDKLERALAVRARAGPEVANPTSRIPATWLDWITCQGEVVDAIEYYQSELMELNGNAQSRQHDIHQKLLSEDLNSSGDGESFISMSDNLSSLLGTRSPSGKFQGLSSFTGVAEEKDAEEIAEDQSETSSLNPTGGVSVKASGSEGIEDYGLNEVIDDSMKVGSHLGKAIGGQVLNGLLTQKDLAVGVTRNTLDAIEMATVGSTADDLEKVDTAFATFTSEFAVAAVCTGYLTHKPYQLRAKLSPSPDDIIWTNITSSRSARFLRQWVAGLGFIVLACLWSVVVSFLASFAVDTEEWFERAGIDEESYTYVLIYEYLPITLQLGLLQLVPLLVQFSSTYYEGAQSFMDVQWIIFTRYFYYQVVNIFVTIGAGSLLVYLKEAYYHPSDIPALLVEYFPKVGSYFIEFLLIKIMFGLGYEISRPWPCIQLLFVRIFTDKRQWTLRALRNSYLSCPDLLYGWAYPSILSVLVIGFTYQIVTPIVAPFALAYFLIAEIIYKNNILFVCKY